MITEEAVKELLGDVIDPELYVDIVSLGLVYDVEIDGDDVDITMTLTFPGCPYGPQLVDNVRDAVMESEEVRNVSVEVTFEPAWSPDKIDPDIRAALGY